MMPVTTTIARLAAVTVIEAVPAAIWRPPTSSSFSISRSTTFCIALTAPSGAPGVTTGAAFRISWSWTPLPGEDVLRVAPGEAWEVCVNQNYDDCRIVDEDMNDVPVGQVGDKRGDLERVIKRCSGCGQGVLQVGHSIGAGDFGGNLRACKNDGFARIGQCE